MRPIEGGRWAAFTPFEAKNRVKAIPTARWYAELRTWTIHDLFAGEARRLIDQLNGDADHELTAMFTSLFAALPERLRRPVYMALVKVVHPDHGGDTRATQALTASWREVAA
jgi:hypothetical protein